jgi:hypothetical protein
MLSLKVCRRCRCYQRPEVVFDNEEDYGPFYTEGDWCCIEPHMGEVFYMNVGKEPPEFCPMILEQVVACQC